MTVQVHAQAIGDSAGGTGGEGGSNGVHPSIAAARGQRMVPGIWEGMGELGRTLVCAMIASVQLNASKR